MRFLLIVLMLFFLAGCSSGSESKLDKALTSAVKDRKLSEKKKQSILAEYNRLMEQDRAKAHQYVETILNAIQMGGDSTHIDVARKQLLGRQKPEIEV